MTDDLEPFDEETSALVDASKTDLEPDAGAQRRIDRRLLLSIEGERASRPGPRRLRTAISILALAASVAVGAGLHALAGPAQTPIGKNGLPLAADALHAQGPVPPSVRVLGALGSPVDVAGRALLDEAAQRLMRGDATGALEKLDEHVRVHPQGPLTELREAMVVEALSRANRSEEAHARAARFSSTYPASLLGPAVNDALDRK